MCVGVWVGVWVGVCVGVLVGVCVGVLVGVMVGVFVGVWVGVVVGVSVGVLVGVCVGVVVGVLVGVSVGVLVGHGSPLRILAPHPSHVESPPKYGSVSAKAVVTTSTTNEARKSALAIRAEELAVAIARAEERDRRIRDTRVTRLSEVETFSRTVSTRSIRSRALAQSSMLGFSAPSFPSISCGRSAPET